MAGTRFKAEYGILATDATSNSVFQHQVLVNANLTVTSDLLYVGGNLYVTGNQIIAGQTIYDTDILPATASGRAIGNTTNVFDIYARTISVSGNITPTSTGLMLGNTGRRWDTYSSNVSASGNVTISGTITSGNSSIAGSLTVTGPTSIQNTAALGNTTITGFVNASSSANVGGSLTVAGTSALTGNVVVGANVTSKGLILDNAAIYSNTAAVTTGATRIDSFPKTMGQFAKAVITVNQTNTLLHMIEILIVHDNTNVIVTKYGELYNTKLGTFDADINGANVDITFTPSSANTYTVKTLRQQFLS